MLSENIKAARQAKGLTQSDLAARLHVVRQTVSKWEQGLSVPDADLLISLSDVLETPVSTLLGESSAAEQPDELKAMSLQLEAINRELAERQDAKRRAIHWILIAVAAVIAIIFVILFFAQSPYLGWDFSDPETAVVGTALHIFEFAFVRIAPIVFVLAIIGAFLTRKRVPRR